MPNKETAITENNKHMFTRAQTGFLGGVAGFIVAGAFCAVGTVYHKIQDGNMKVIGA